MADSFGMSYAECTLPDGNTIFAEIVPAPKRHWRPTPHRYARWWYEVYSTQGQTYAYEVFGSDGGFTLASCMTKAGAAVQRFVDIEMARLKVEGRLPAPRRRTNSAISEEGE